MSENTLTARWTTDADRELRVVIDYIWSLRPSILRWQFLAAIGGVGILAAVLTMSTDSVWGTVLCALLAVLLGLTLTLLILVRWMLPRSIRAAMAPDGTDVMVVLNDAGWHGSGAGRAQSTSWETLNRCEVRGDDVIVSAVRKGSWMPRLITAAPLSAFGDDRDRAVAFITERISQR